MGEVRSTIESPSRISPLVQLREIREKLWDMMQTKAADLESEGKGMETKNVNPIDILSKAIRGVGEAIAALEGY